jgi:hypothetical protein
VRVEWPKQRAPRVAQSPPLAGVSGVLRATPFWPLRGHSPAGEPLVPDVLPAANGSVLVRLPADAARPKSGTYVSVVFAVEQVERPLISVLLEVE